MHFTNRILPESARWLITQGKKEQAIKEIHKAAKVNGRKVPEEMLEKVCTISVSKGFQCSAQDSEGFMRTLMWSSQDDFMTTFLKNTQCQIGPNTHSNNFFLFLAK